MILREMVILLFWVVVTSEEVSGQYLEMKVCLVLF